MQKGVNVAEKNGMWKGDAVGYKAVHSWIRRRLPQPPNCERCGKKADRLDLANISQEYLRRLDDWEYLCRQCHMKGDGRMGNLLRGTKKRPLKACQMCGRLTTGFKFCKECAKTRRREWWKKYNKTPERKSYMKKWLN